MGEAKVWPVRVNPVVTHAEERRIRLRGGWRFRLDPDERGLTERWFADPNVLGNPIEVPGSWQGQGYGGDGTDTVWDFTLHARTLRATYTGTGWYGRMLTIPGDWAGRRVWLNFGGVFPSAEIWLDGVRLGDHGMPFVPFAFEITDLVQPGAEHYVAVRIHEADRMYGFAYSFQGNWSGLYRDVELSAAGPVWLRELSLYPDAQTDTLTVDAVLDGCATEPLALRIAIAGGPAAEFPITGAETRYTLPMPGARRWSPDTPNLYRVDAALVRGDEVLDARSERTGFVSLATEGKHILINGDPYYLRGTGDFVSCPETGCPDTDRERWRRKLRTLRDYGYNYVRCQSYVYGPEYYDAADEVGLIVQSEMGMLGGWGGHNAWHVYAWPPPSPQYREHLRAQWNAVVRRDVNHPSALIYCMSNELGGSTLYPRVAWQCARETQAIRPNAFVLWTDGGLNEELPGEFVNAEGNEDEKTAKPVVQHEYRWWSSFPDVRLAERYSGAIRPYGAEIARAAAARHGIAHVLPEAAAMSQRLQFAESKVKMEQCRRDFPRLSGICQFNAMDANPSPQGIITEFYEHKYADVATWQETNGDTVILSGLNYDDRVVVPGQTVRVALSVSDFSHPAFTAPQLAWQLLAGEAVLASGAMGYAHTPYQTCPAGEIELTMPVVNAPTPVELRAVLREGERTVTNRWSLWILPDEQPAAPVYGAAAHTWLAGWTGRTADLGTDRVVLAERLDDGLLEFIRNGGRVILAAGEGLVKPYNPKFGFTAGQYFFTPPANYPPYEDGHDGTIIRSHPMLGDFPHEGFADFQFFRLMDKAPSMPLEPLGLNGADPIIRVMHSYPAGRSLGYLAEAGYGQGRLILCALELNNEWPEARALLARLLAYAVGVLPPAPITLTDEALAAIVAGTNIA